MTLEYVSWHQKNFSRKTFHDTRKTFHDSRIKFYDTIITFHYNKLTFYDTNIMFRDTKIAFTISRERKRLNLQSETVLKVEYFQHELFVKLC